MRVDEIRDYCLNCKIRPCQNNGCPLKNNIPNFIHETDTKKAYEILCNTTVLPAVCGRICPHEKQCQGSCVRGIKGKPVSIGKMETYIGDESIKNKYEIPKDIDVILKQKKVAVMGGGPAGLTCASFLAKKGVKVTIFDKHENLGGILEHGIPEFRLEKNIVRDTINKILNLGINFERNKELGKNIFIEELTNNFDAVFIAIGANVSTKMNIPGENFNGVFGGNELLEYKKFKDFTGKKVAISGGGNVAMDTSRTIKRLGADRVYVIYRRAEEQMPAERKEIQDAKNEGIEFLFQTNILEVLAKDNKNVSGLECIKTELVKKEGETRLSPVNIKGSNFNIDIDNVVMCIGSKIEEKPLENFEKDKWGYIQVNEKMQTGISKVFAGGDVVGEKKTVAWAARSGRNAAENIIEFLKNNK